MWPVADKIKGVTELSTVVVKSLCGEAELSSVFNNSNVFFPCSWHYGVPSVTVRDHCTVTMPSPVSSLLIIFVTSDRREGTRFKENDAGFGMDAGIVLCINRGEADKQLGRLQLYRKGFAGGYSTYQLTISQQRHGVEKKKGKVKHPWDV